MLVAVDVDYRPTGARAAAVSFVDFGDAAPSGELVASIERVEPYEPGRLFLRELPCLLAVLARIEQPLACVLVDGYVWLGARTGERPGLGAHLWDALGRRVPVVGVAKTPFAGATAAIAVMRGRSARPLWVTAAGMDAARAAESVARMHGAHRIPTLLRRADRLARDAP